MWKLHDVVEATYVSDYKIRIKFDDGIEAVVDFKKWVGSGPVFEALKDVDFFKKFTIDGGTITWPNGADIAPETLYKITSDKAAA